MYDFTTEHFIRSYWSTWQIVIKLQKFSVQFRFFETIFKSHFLPRRWSGLKDGWRKKRKDTQKYVWLRLGRSSRWFHELHQTSHIFFLITHECWSTSIDKSESESAWSCPDKFKSHLRFRVSSLWNCYGSLRSSSTREVVIKNKRFSSFVNWRVKLQICRRLKSYTAPPTVTMLRWVFLETVKSIFNIDVGNTADDWRDIITCRWNCFWWFDLTIRIVMTWQSTRHTCWRRRS